MANRKNRTTVNVRTVFMPGTCFPNEAGAILIPCFVDPDSVEMMERRDSWGEALLIVATVAGGPLDGETVGVVTGCRGADEAEWFHFGSTTHEHEWSVLHTAPVSAANANEWVAVG